MYRHYPYLVLFVVCVLLQVFLFANLSVGIHFDPLVYVAFLLLLPLDTPPVAMLGAGLLTGVTMDCAMGAAGINTIASLFAAFVRPMLVAACCGRGNACEGGVPSPERMGRPGFAYYLASFVFVHHALFFLLEALSWSLLPHTLLRIVASGCATAVFAWLLMRLFTAKLPVGR